MKARKKGTNEPFQKVASVCLCSGGYILVKDVEFEQERRIDIPLSANISESVKVRYRIPKGSYVIVKDNEVIIKQKKYESKNKRY